MHQLSHNEVFSKRGRADFFSTNYKIALMNANCESPIRDRYRYSTFCNEKLLKEGNKITGKYCNQRWCITCNRNRTAILMDSYLPEVQNIEDPRFVTLTLKNCKADELRDRVKLMISIWSKIQRKLHRRLKTKGYRKLEVTHNQKFNDFHPHFHAIINGKDNAEWIINQWILAVIDAGIEIDRQWQDERPADLNSMKELFKYTTKILPKKTKGQTWEQIFKEDKNVKRFLNGQDVIFQALDRIRCFQPFGFRPKKDQQEEDTLSLQSQEIDVDLPDGIYVRDRRGNWEHIKEDVKLHNRNLTDNCINLVRWMGGKYIRFL
jgi:hypothetical protein